MHGRRIASSSPARESAGEEADLGSPCGAVFTVDRATLCGGVFTVDPTAFLGTSHA
jgi:hypothetical protein